MECKICGRKVVSRNDLTSTDLRNPSKMVYHANFGFACLAHQGVRDHFREQFGSKRRVLRLQGYSSTLDRVFKEGEDFELINRIRSKMHGRRNESS